MAQASGDPIRGILDALQDRLKAHAPDDRYSQALAMALVAICILESENPFDMIEKATYVFLADAPLP